MPGHPLLFGLAASPAFLVVDGEPPLRLPEAKANVVTVAPDEPLLSGFGWKEALERWKGAAVVQLEESGRGRVVSFAADPVFRGVWRGSEAVFLNAVLLGPSLGLEGQRIRPRSAGSAAPQPRYSRRRRTTVRSSWNGTPAAKAASPSPMAVFDLGERPRRDAADQRDEPVEAELVVVGIRGLGDAVGVEDEEVAGAEGQRRRSRRPAPGRGRAAAPAPGEARARRAALRTMPGLCPAFE